MKQRRLRKAIIVDIDGTLAIIGDRSPYDPSNCVLVDQPNRAVLETIVNLYRDDVNVIFITGRSEKYRQATREFIERYCVFNEITLSYELHMRGELDGNVNDNRRDVIVKRELYDAFVDQKYDVLACFDDRQRVCDLWSSLGLTVFKVIIPGVCNERI